MSRDLDQIGSVNFAITPVSGGVGGHLWECYPQRVDGASSAHVICGRGGTSGSVAFTTYQPKLGSVQQWPSFGFIFLDQNPVRRQGTPLCHLRHGRAAAQVALMATLS